MATEIVEEYEVSITRACRLMEIHRSYFYYVDKTDDTEVEDAIREAGQFGEGFWKIFKIIRRQGFTWNHKKVYRVYKNLHFEKRSRLKKRLPARVKNPLVTPDEPNTTWSIDFVSDVVENGRKFRVRNVLDDADRSIVAQEIFLYTQPGCPTQNSYIERFNGSYRRAVLDAYLFRNLNEVRDITDKWMAYYNEQRPHDALEDMSPKQYRTHLSGGSLDFDKRSY